MDRDRDVSKTNGEDEGVEVSSPIENQEPGIYDDTMLVDFPIDDNLIPSNTKKRKSDMSLTKRHY